MICIVLTCPIFWYVLYQPASDCRNLPHLLICIVLTCPWLSQPAPLTDMYCINLPPTCPQLSQPAPLYEIKDFLHNKSNMSMVCYCKHQNIPSLSIKTTINVITNAILQQEIIFWGQNNMKFVSTYPAIFSTCCLKLSRFQNQRFKVKIIQQKVNF